MDLQKGLVGHWTMDNRDTSNSVMYDKTPYNNHGTIQSGVITSVSAPVGEGYDLEQDKISGFSTKEIGASSFSFSFWLKGDFNSVSNTYPDVFNDFWGRGDGDSGFRFDSESTGRYVQAFKYPNDLPNWTHISCSVDQSIGEGYFYQDGTKIYTDTFTPGEYIPTSITFFGNDDCPMKVSDFRFYKRALSEREIKTLYNMRNQQVRRT